ncbi:MAG: hypothetical protein PHR44_05475 [Candidatus Omnitrophica bacterium]|nr:hypothetical protein [Candidatus Omnitrophota bacterium]
MKKVIALLALAVSINGCNYLMYGSSSVRFTKFTEAEYPPKTEKEEISLFSTIKPDRPYKEIGIIKISKCASFFGTGGTPHRISDERDMIKKAREVGADAVIDIKQMGMYETGTAIVFTDK